MPDRQLRELRELVRYRRSLIEERSREVNRIQKVLEGANIKLSSVATDIVGVSGRAILEAMISGVEDTKVLADMAKGVLRRKKASLEEALQGVMGDSQRTVLSIQLDHLDSLDQHIARLDDEIDRGMKHMEEALRRVDTLPGIDRRGAQEVLVETGTNMGIFPGAGHFSSWIGLCPGNNESAGKRKSGRTRKGNRWLTSTLVRAARSAVRSPHNYFYALYHRIVGRRGDGRAIVAVANSMAVTIYHMLSEGTEYHDLGPHYFDERDQQRVVQRAVRRIESLGYKVTLGPATA